MNSKIVYVDLTKQKIRERPITKEVRRNYIGAIGINVMLLNESDAIYHDFLSEENVLILGVGPIVGTGMMAGNRCVVTTKSPITDMYGDSNVGGLFPVRMKALGIDHLVIEGKASKPVYILLKAEGSIEILDAIDLWGEATDQATDILIKRHGEKAEVACIGQGGENLVRYSSIIMSKNHAAGRMGTGCIMGSKNLKAIVVESKKMKRDYYDRQKFNEIRKRWLRKSRKSPISRIGARYGTLFLLELNNRTGGLPVRNFTALKDSQATNMYPVVFNHKYKVKREACYSCPIACSKMYKVKKGKYKGITGSRIEYGAASIGPITGIFHWPGTLHLKLLCDKYGLDTIELGAVIALTMEGYQRGLITKGQLFGRTVKFGSVEDAEYIINLIVDRKGIGDTLAEGVYRSAIKLGLEDYSFCINKSYTGLQSNNRLVRSLGYLTSTRGGDHLKSFAFTMQNGGYYIAKHIFNIRNVKKQLDKPVDIGRILWWHENYKIIVDSIGVCLFAIQGLPFTGAGYFDDFTEIMNSIYGLDMTEEEVFLAAERIYQIENGFNICCGLNIDRYIWPERKQDEDINEKLLVNTRISVRDEPGMLPEYFKYRGLTRRGLPSEKRFKELNINNSVKGLKLYKDDSIYSMKSLMDTVALTVNFNRFDKIYMNLQGFIMDNMIRLKDKLDIWKMKKL